MRNFLVILLCTSCIACSFNDSLEVKNLQSQVKIVTEELANTKLELAVLKNDLDAPLAHFVYFQLKEDADRSSFITELRRLSEIKSVKNFEIGVFKNLDDPRALSEYDVSIAMAFRNETAYEEYQNDPIHLDVKGNLKPFLAGPPVSYDYMKQ